MASIKELINGYKDKIIDSQVIYAPRIGTIIGFCDENSNYI